MHYITLKIKAKDSLHSLRGHLFAEVLFKAFPGEVTNVGIYYNDKGFKNGDKIEWLEFPSEKFQEIDKRLKRIEYMMAIRDEK